MSKKSGSLTENLQKKIEIAQDSVSKLTDESLKAIAFKVVLETLLKTEDIPDFAPEKSVDDTPKEIKNPKQEKKTSVKGPKGRIEALIEDGFFNEKRTISEIKDALEARTWYHRQEDLSPQLVRLVKEKKLRRIKEPEKEGGKLIWRYSNW